MRTKIFDLKCDYLPLDKHSNSALVKDVFTLVKGGIVDSSSGLAAIRNPDTYRRWGASLKYNPTLIEHEVKTLKGSAILGNLLKHLIPLSVTFSPLPLSNDADHANL